MVADVVETISGGPEALREQVRGLHQNAFAWAVSCCRLPEQDPEEVLQDTYAKIISGKARFDGRSSFKTWLFGVVRWTALEHRRRGLMRAIGLGRFQRGVVEPPSRPGTDDLVDESRRTRVLREVLLELPDRQREVLHLVFYEGLAVSEAALAMGVSVGSARTHYHRGKQNLRAKLEKRGMNDDR